MALGSQRIREVDRASCNLGLRRTETYKVIELTPPYFPILHPPSKGKVLDFIWLSL